MRRFALIVVASVAFAATACVKTAVNEATGEVDLDIESPTQQGEDWGGNIMGQGSWASITGTSRALVAQGRTQLTITIENAQPGANFTWVVREGRCGEQGAVVGAANSYRALAVDSQGKAGTTMEIAARLDEAKDYVVELYATSTDPATGRPAVAACGDLDD